MVELIILDGLTFVLAQGSRGYMLAQDDLGYMVWQLLLTHD